MFLTSVSLTGPGYGVHIFLAPALGGCGRWLLIKEYVHKKLSDFIFEDTGIGFHGIACCVAITLSAYLWSSSASVNNSSN